MPKSPFFKCYPSDFLNGISDMSPNQITVYTVVIMRLYDEDGAIEDSPRKIARRCNMRLPACEKALNQLVEDGKLVRSGGKLLHERVTEEIAKRHERNTKQTRNAHKRWHEGDENPNKNNDGTENRHSQTDAKPMPTRSQKLETRNQKEERGGAEAQAYVFKGKVIRLKQKDFERWEKSYPHVPDIVAELTAADEYFSENPSADGKWYFRASNWLKKASNEASKPVMEQKAFVPLGVDYGKP